MKWEDFNRWFNRSFWRSFNNRTFPINFLKSPKNKEGSCSSD